MPLDRTAQAAQLARIFAHAGEPLSFGGLALDAVIEAWVPPVTSTDVNVGDDTCVLVKVPRALFTAGLPRQGQHFSAANGTTYRVQSLPSIPPTAPIVHFVCAVSTPTP